MQKPVSDFRGEEIAPPGEAAGAPAPSRRRHWAAAIGAGLLLAIALFVVLFQWNWLRGPLAHLLSARLHRTVAIAGNLEVHPWSLAPTILINDMTVADAPWAPRGAMARIPRLTARVELLPLIGGQAIFPLIEADNPDVRLLSDADGRADWKFGGGPAGARPAPPPIGHLIIRGGKLRLTDIRRRFAFAGTLDADETIERTGEAGGATIRGALLVGNPPWAGPAPLARAPAMVIETRLLAAMRGKLALTRVVADRPDIRLIRDASGRENWRSGTPGGAKPLKLPPIDDLVITGGSLRYDDERRPLHFQGVVTTSQRLTGPGQGVFELKGEGRLNQAPFVAVVTGGALVNADRTRPWRFSAHAQAGATRAAMTGAIAHPFDLGRVSGRLSVSGQDLSNLYPFTGLALPMTPPYALSGGFSRVGAIYAVRRLSGRVGSSDLAGALTVDDASGRPFVTGDLASRRLRLVDLAPAFGGAPRNPAGHIVSPAERQIGARLRAEHRLLPDTPLDVKRVREMDARLAYRAQTVDAGRLPIRTLAMKVTLDHGVLSLDPVSMGLPQGDFAGDVRIDARRSTPFTSMDVRVANARLEHLTARGSGPAPLGGGLFARARLSGAGASVRAAAANANGEFSVVVPGGEIRQSLAELLGIDVTKGLFLLLTKKEQMTPIRCGIADFRATDGVLQVQRIVLDTGVVLVSGSGDISLRDETVNLRLSGKPKKFRLIRLAAPITVKGAWEAPKFGVDVGKAAGQLVVSGLLGALVSPAVVLLPFVSPGLAHNADCAALLAAARGKGAPLASSAG